MSLVQSFRAARWVRTINLIAQAILFVTLFGGLNYLALHYAWRFDLTRLRSNSLSAETRSYLAQLSQPVRIVITLPRDSNDPAVQQANRDLTELLREYAYATEANPNGKVTFDYLDVYQRGREAKELGLVDPGPTLVLCGDKRHLISPSELYRIENNEKKAFLGEQVVTAAILDVSSSDKKKIYFLTGHGEMDPESTDPNRGLSVLLNELRMRNFDVDRLDFAAHRKIPDDATLIVSAGAQNRYEPFEQELLRQYLSTRAGRLMLLLPPGVAHGLDDLLYDWGALADDVVIYDTDPASLNDTGDLMLRAFDGKHPITQLLISNQTLVRFGVSRSVRVNPSRSTDETLTATRIIGTSKTAWGERSYRLRRMPQYNPGVDMPGEVLGTAVASERVSAKDKNLPFSVPAGRLVTFGCADFIGNERIGAYGNLTLTLSTVNWLVGRGTQLNVPARPIQKFQLALNQQELLRLRYSLLFALPLAAALLGFIVYWTRRR